MSSTNTPPVRIVDALRYMGPGLILTAGIVGTGELVLTPRVAGENGFKLLWLILLGCLIKVFVQVELGRFTVAKGMSTLKALDSVPGPRLRVSWLLWVWLPVFVAMISVIGGIIGGTAEVLRMAGLPLGQSASVVIVGAACTLLLAFGRYRWIEFFSTLLVVMFTVSTLIAVGALQWTEYRISASQVLDGFLFHMPDNFSSAFATLGIIGVGAAELIYYPYWCLEKGYAQRVGPRTGDDSGWTQRAQGWLRVMRVDAWSSMIIYTTATLAFYMLGAAILYAKGLKVSNQDLVPTLAHMYLETFGSGGLWIFLAGAFATLFSTAFAGSASNARLLSDAMEIFSVVKADRDESARLRRVRWCSIGLPLYATLLYLAWPKPVTLILISGVGQALLLPFLAGAALYFRYRRLDVDLRPGRVWTFFLWLSALCLGSAGLWQLREQLAKLF